MTYVKNLFPMVVALASTLNVLIVSEVIHLTLIPPPQVISRVDKVIDYSPRSIRRFKRSQASLSSLLPPVSSPSSNCSSIVTNTTPNACPTTPSNPQYSIHIPNPATIGPHHNRQPQDPICTNISPQPLICDLDPDDEPYPISPSTQSPSPIPTTNHQQSPDQTVAFSGCTVVNCDSTNPPLSPHLISSSPTFQPPRFFLCYSSSTTAPIPKLPSIES